MRLILDCEFTGLHKNTTLISLALFTENDDVFYAEFNDYDKTQVDEWLQDNVITNLLFNDYEFYLPKAFNSKYFALKTNKSGVISYLTHWLEFILIKNNTTKFEVWSDCLAYDWVIFNDLFDHAFNLPKSIYYIPFDLCTAFKLNGIDPDINREEFSGYKYTELDKKHNALTDAKVIKACLDKLLINIDTYYSNII